ncbi:hypothetical protein [Chitinophaga sp. YIM B06452]|uniref:hypothetical protein n=1 Tax=Chitinophaga sp. YIM B06452 TaxID=3082158 RepID=UPI0031FE5D38
MGRYGEIPVTLQSGIPNIQIPIYEVVTGNQKLPISISFHGGGIRVTDKASPVGLGWALNAGGVINRVVQGIPDENSQYGFLKQVLDNDDPGFNEKLRCQAIFSQYVTGMYQTDLQPDIFMYSLPGKTGKFMHKNKKYVDMHPGFMTIPYDPIKIDTNSIYDGYFRITDSDGTEYMFGKDYEGNSCVEGFYRYEGFASWSAEHRAAWFLAGMVSPDKNDTIRFIYTTPGNDVTESNPVTLTGTVHDDTNPLSLQFSKSPASNKYDYTTNVRLLQTIRFKNGEVRFTYDANRRLQEIKVVAINSALEEQVFRWQFFRDAEKLDSLRQVGTNGIPLPAFKIDYVGNASGQYVRPPYNSNGRDLWGFYNGKDNNPDLLWVDGINGMPAPVSVIERRMPNEEYMQYGQIKKITYPTGGSSEFIFEPNKTTYQTYRNDTIWNTISHRVYTWIPTYGNAQPSVTFTVTQPLTTKNRGGGVQSNAELTLNINRTCTPGSPQQPWCVPNTVRVRLLDVTSGQTLVAEIWLPAYNQQTSIEKRFFDLIVGHTYQLVLPDPGNVGTGQLPQYNLDAVVKGDQYLSHTTVPVVETVLGGGMRIKQIIHADGTGKRSLKEYAYPRSYWNSDYFNGDFNGFANSTFSHDRLRRGAGVHDAPRPFYKTWHENLSVPLGSIYGTSLANEIVEEYDKDPESGDTLGKISYRFNLATDYVPRWMPFYKLDYDHIRNQLLTKKIYRNTESGMQLIQRDSMIYKTLMMDLLEKTMKFVHMFLRCYGSAEIMTEHPL